MKKLPLLIGLLWIGIANSQLTLTLQPNAIDGKDAFINDLSTQQNTNFGSNSQLTAASVTISSTPAIIRALIDFDLSTIPQNSIISNAKISFYAWDSTIGFGAHTPGINAAYIQRVTSNWDENTVTWANKPTSTSANRVFISSTTTSNEDKVNIDITQLIQDIINEAPANRHGLLLYQQFENSRKVMNFCSSDHGNPLKRPKLEVTYTPVISQTLILQPDSTNGKDAFIHGLSSQHNVNYGKNEQLPNGALTFSNVPGALRTLIDFDLSAIPAGATIQSATLDLYAWSSLSGYGNHIGATWNAADIYRITSNWNENTVTWANQPNTSSVNVTTSPSTTSTNDDISIDVKNLVQDMIDSSNSYGFLIRTINETPSRLMNFCSSDHPDSTRHPKLTINYTLATTGITKKSKSLDFNLINRNFEIEVNSSEQVNQVFIYDLRGTLMVKSDFENKKKMNIESLSSGLYIITVQFENQTIKSKKFFKH